MVGRRHKGSFQRAMIRELELGIEHLELRTMLATTAAPMVQFADPTVEVSGGQSFLTRHADSISIRAEATRLTPGDAVTAWWAVFNHPEFCGNTCGVNDLHTDDVGAALIYAAHQVVADDGTATFAATLTERDTTYVDPAHLGLSGAGRGLMDANMADVHLVLRTHGAASEDAVVLEEQLNTFNGGCNPVCANLQGTDHRAPDRDVSIEPMVLFSDPTIPIDGGMARLTRDDDQVSIRADATQLTPGDAVTAWWAVFNHPEFCGGPCGVNDLRTPEVGAALIYAAHQVVAEDGTATFMSTLAERDVTYVDPAHAGLPGAGVGLSDAETADVHLVLRTHGAASDDAAILDEQLNTFNGGCNPDCGNLQATDHRAPERDVSVEPMVLFSDPTISVDGGVARLTRDADQVSIRADATQLTPGDAVTAWWAVFNHPEFCGGPCGVNDLRTPEVGAALVYAAHQVVAEDGTATFMSTLAERDVTDVDPAHAGLPGAGVGMSNAATADVHLVLRTHGAASDDAAILDEQLNTFNGGCNPDCANLQATDHRAPDRDVTIKPMVMFSDPSVEIDGGVSRLTRDGDQVSIRTDATHLTPGDAVTAWWAVFNHPEFCSGPCGPEDLRTPEVGAALVYAAGQVVADDGTATFMSTLDERDPTYVDPAHTGFPGADVGLTNANSADIHFVLRTHGAASEDPATLEEQLNTFNGGCNPECGNLQAADHAAPGRDVSVQPVVLFSDPSMEVNGGVSRLTRDEDGVSIRMDTTDLPPGDAVTAWWAIFNHPEYCNGPCSPADLRTPEVQAALVYADYQIVSEDGQATFMSTLESRDILMVDPDHAGLPGAAMGLMDSKTADIHMVLRTHGAASDDPEILEEQITTFNGGCNPDCANLQATIHPPRVDVRLPGDANDDGLFNFIDLIAVFAAGEYDDQIDGNSTFDEGDWNGDGEFDADDLIFAFQQGHYTSEARPTASSALIAAAVDLALADDENTDRRRR